MHNDNCEPPQQQSLWSAHSDLNTALSPIIKETINTLLDILRTTYSIVTRTVENARATVGKDSFHGQFSQVQAQDQIYANSS